MITVAGTDKSLGEMTEDELAAIIADHNHTIRLRRYINTAHLEYLQSRLHACQEEMAGRR